MANASTSSGPSHPVIFSTSTQYPLPTQKFLIPVAWKRYQLSQLVNKALQLEQPVPFDFLVRGEILRTSLAEWCSEKGLGEEETLEIEYIQSVLPPTKASSQPHQEWVSAVSCHIKQHFLTASYDGHLRLFSYSQLPVITIPVHPSAITSVDVAEMQDDYLVATSSHDLTARITKLSVSTGNPSKSSTTASLHLHTGPVSSVAISASGDGILTSSWDGTIGVWDTVIPAKDEVPLDLAEEGSARKKRKVTATENADRPRRKAPVNVLKGHSSRVSKVVFDRQGSSQAYSCGFDATVRTWDIETGVNIATATTPEKPMIDLVLSLDGHMAFSASTDRTVSLFDLRTSSSTTTVGSFIHPATPSCLSPSPSSEYQVASGAYDGLARLWDTRSIKSPITTFKPWEGRRKILSIDWIDGLVGIGGEEGLEIWRV